jgi:predicted nucleotidyltransferase
MLTLPKDFRDILSALNAHGAKYLIVGGYAVSVYSEPRATKDIDLWIKTDSENSAAVYRALIAFGAPLADVSAEDFNTKAQTGFQIGVAPFRIDILHEIDGISFDEAWENRIEAIVDNDLTVQLISLNDLLKNKLHSGRPRDLLDVKSIREATLKSRS